MQKQRIFAAICKYSPEKVALMVSFQPIERKGLSPTRCGYLRASVRLPSNLGTATLGLQYGYPSPHDGYPLAAVRLPDELRNTIQSM